MVNNPFMRRYLEDSSQGSTALEQAGKLCLFKFLPVYNHRSDGFGCKKGLRHAMPTEACAYVLPGAVRYFPDVGTTIVGIAHD
jgi:hypothetical protein